MRYVIVLITVASMVFLFSMSANKPPMPAPGQSDGEFIDSLAEKWLEDEPDDPAKLLDVADRFLELEAQYAAEEERLAVGLDDDPKDIHNLHYLILGLKVDANVRANSLRFRARQELLTREEKDLLRKIRSSKERVPIIKHLVDDERLEAARSR